MTREEAIEVIKQDIPCEHDTDLIEALEMAIQALSQEPICDRDCEHCTWTECPIEPCDDAISRDAVINMLEGMIKDRQVYFGHHGDIEYSCGFSTFKWYIEQLPSVTQKSGKWLYIREDKYTCSKCGTITRVDEGGIDEKPMYKFCPYCGCRMVEPQEGEE